MYRSIISVGYISIEVCLMIQYSHLLADVKFMFHVTTPKNFEDINCNKIDI